MEDNETQTRKNIFVFDVEATELHGDGFAVGAVVYKVHNNTIEIIDEFSLQSLESRSECNDWVKENVIPKLKGIKSVNKDRTLRDKFFEFYMKHMETCDIWSDVNYPVETNFLEDVCNDDREEREFLMPYPLKDISTIVSLDVPRWPNANVHNPLEDAKASANCLIAVLMLAETLRIKDLIKI